MKYEFITAGLLLALTSGALAEHPRADRVLNRLDANGDGLVSIDEFQPPRGGSPLLDRGDTDGDGVVTVDELHARHAERISAMREGFKARSEKIAAMIDGLDSDGDGVVTQDEARAAAFARFDDDGDGYLSADELRGPRNHHNRRGKRHRDVGERRHGG